MTAAMADVTAARARQSSASARVVGVVLTCLITAWCVAGFALFTARARGAASALFTMPADQVDAALSRLGWSGGLLFAVVVAVQLIVVVATVVASAFILSAPRTTPYLAALAAVLVAFVATSTFAAMGWATTFPGAAPAIEVATAGAAIAFLALAPLFPTGTAVPRWSVAIPLSYAGFAVVSLVFPWWTSASPWPIVAAAALAVTLVVATVVAQVLRYGRFSDGTARQQTKWVVLALSVYLTTLIPVYVLPPGSIDGLAGPGGIAFQVIRGGISALAFGGIAVAIALAIARFRLFEVDLVIRRTVVWGLLVVLIAVVYLAAIGLAGLIWQGSGVWPAVGATLMVALLAHPARMWLQRRVTRWIYGARGDPYAVVSRLGDELRDLRLVAEIAARVTDVLVGDLRYSYARVDVGGRRFERGDAAARRARPLTLVHDGRVFGAVVIGTAAGDRVDAADGALVRSVATQAGFALGAALAADEVRASRERLAVAQEEERHRLYRDLHDGVGPALAGARQRIDTAMALRETNPDASLRLLEEASAGMSAMLGEVRGLVQGLRPPALDELGLVEAVRAATAPAAASVDVTVEGTTGVLSPAVEVAAYRIAVEAITNALRHSAAGNVAVSFATHGDSLAVRVSDDGDGFADAAAGGGLRSMRDRAESLGGRLRIDSTARGTVVEAQLPVAHAALSVGVEEAAP